MSRRARVERETRETKILVELDLDGTGVTDVGTGVPFFDHMLAQLGKHGLLDLSVQATGDIHIDAHHTVEDTALALGQALRDERDALVAWLRQRGRAVADSDANFVLFGQFADRRRVWQGLLDQGVLIRETGPAGWLRVTVGLPTEMKAFQDALDKVLGEA